MIFETIPEAWRGIDPSPDRRKSLGRNTPFLKNTHLQGSERCQESELQRIRSQDN